MINNTVFNIRIDSVFMSSHTYSLDIDILGTICLSFIIILHIVYWPCFLTMYETLYKSTEQRGQNIEASILIKLAKTFVPYCCNKTQSKYIIYFHLFS